jgi:hypothetical protein
VLSTPYFYVWLNVFVSLIIGCVFELLSSVITGAVTPKGEEASR